MLTIQKNEFFDTIRAAKLNPALFKLDDSSDELTTIKVASLIVLTA